jgi:hypothetical protein
LVEIKIAFANKMCVNMYLKTHEQITDFSFTCEMLMTRRAIKNAKLEGLIFVSRSSIFFSSALFSVQMRNLQYCSAKNENATLNYIALGMSKCQPFVNKNAEKEI